MIDTEWMIAADSSCDLIGYTPAAPEAGFATVPLKIRVGEKEFADEPGLNVDDMLEAMEAHSGPTSSACPSPDEWAQLFLAADQTIAVTMTSSLSGTYNSAVVARDMVLERFPHKRIHIIDTLSTGGQMALLIRRIDGLIAQGLDYPAVVAGAQAYQQSLRLLFCLASFDNLVKNGRMNRIVGFVAGALRMRAVGHATERGELGILHKTRGEGRALSFLIEELARNKNLAGLPVIISHCQNQPAADKLRQAILERWPSAQVEIMSTRGLTSYYAQQQGLIIGY